MVTEEHYRKPVVTVHTGALVQEVAEQLARHSVGCAVVVTEEARPVGIITDRDLAIRVIAQGREAGHTPARAVMSEPLVAVDTTAPLDEILKRMDEHGVRRVAVLSGEDVAGLVSLDDVLATLGAELHRLGSVAPREIHSSQRAERLSALQEEIEGLLAKALDHAEGVGTKARAALSRELESIRETLSKRFS